jgi:glucose-1-phosphatase
LENILFDLGNVLVGIDRDRAYRRLTPKLSPSLKMLLEKDRKQFERIFSPYVAQLETGSISFQEFHGLMIRALGVDFSDVEFLELWCDIFYLDRDMVKLGTVLSKRYRTLLVSNTSEAHYRWIVDRFPEVIFFNHAALSYELGVMKPHTEYYEQAVEKFGINPLRSVFIDDSEENVEGAIRAGMKGIVFKDKLQLIEKLTGLGIVAPQFNDVSEDRS